jgi:NADH:ubiquinone oxidoreductase subunit F (NADH-binding)
MTSPWSDAQADVIALPLLAGAITYFGGSTDEPCGGHRQNLREHREARGPRIPGTGEWGVQLHRVVREIGLSGRGGAHFPVAVKWEAARQAPAGGAVVVNGAEGEPAAAKDAALLQHSPHVVLDGAQSLAEYIGAREVVIWLHDDAITTYASVALAISERVAAGESGRPMRIVTVGRHYVSGESSAVIRAVQPTVQGRKPGIALPLFVADPARPWGKGPMVLVHNTETLARVGSLVTAGLDPARYRATSLITVAEPGPGLHLSRRTVIEVADGTRLADVVAAAGVVEPGSILLGGYSGTWLGWSHAAGLPLDPVALRASGLSLGAGVVLVIPPDRDPLAHAALLADYLADSSARQCGPCMFGLPAVAEALDRVARSHDGDDAAHVRSLMDIVSGRGACRHPDGAVRMVRSAVEAFL